MVNSINKQDNGKKILLYRAYTNNNDLSSTQYRPPTVFKVGTGNADINATDNDLTNPVIITGIETTKEISAGYPVIDLVNFEVTNRCYLNSLEANGNLINAVGLFNEDSSPLMSDAAKFDGQSKSNTEEFVYILKDRVRTE